MSEKQTFKEKREERKKEKYSQYRDPNNEFQKPKNFFKTALRLLSLLKGNRVLVVIVMVMGAGGAYLSILGPQYLGGIIDLLNEQIKLKLNSGHMNFSEISHVLLTILIIYTGSSLLAFFQHFTMAGITQNLITDLRYKINKKLSALPLSYFDKHNKGDILSRVTNDVDNINNTFQNNFIQIITSVVSFVGVFAIMLKNNKIMTAASLAPLPIGLVIALAVLNCSKKYFRNQWKVTGEVNGHVEEMFTGHKIVKAYGHEEKAISEFDEINDNLCGISMKAQFYSGLLGPLINFTNNLGYVFICVIGGYLIIKNQYSIGTITMFMAYSKLFMQPLVDMSNIVNNLQSSLASAERVFDIIDAKEEIADNPKIKIDNPKGYVEFDNVSFSYLEDKPLIENFNLSVEPGQLIAIVGPTGAGKTTIVNLLMRFYEIQKGRILVDGTDIRDISRSNLRNIFGMVLQDTWLFEGTIRDNIKYGNENATDEEFMNAVNSAKVDHFINTLSDGYDTILSEDGTNLSAGQRQLLTIARAILSDPEIIILDEATSSVDTRTEIQIQKAMANLMDGRTNFVIAHRLSTIRDADMIIVMDDGKIVEHGKHEELLSKNGFYADLYNSQFRH